MINVTKSNDFKLKATFTRGGEAYKFDSVSAANLFVNLDKKFEQKFAYDAETGTLTVYCTSDVPSGNYGLEVIGKEGDSQRRTAFTGVVGISNTTTAGGYDPVEDIGSYDIGMHVELDMSVEKKSSEAEGAATPAKSDTPAEGSGEAKDASAEQSAEGAKGEGDSAS